MARVSNDPRTPEAAEAHYLLAQSLEEQGQLEGAAESLARATALRPGFADAHNDLGRVLLALGRTDAAIASCRRALELRPRFAAALGNLANAERARGALAAAIEGYRQVIALEPALAEAHRNLGSALIDIDSKVITVIFIKSIPCPKPEKSILILKNCVNCTLRKAIY